jgi:hypothetical protein
MVGYGKYKQKQNQNSWVGKLEVDAAKNVIAGNVSWIQKEGFGEGVSRTIYTRVAYPTISSSATATEKNHKNVSDPPPTKCMEKLTNTTEPCT